MCLDNKRPAVDTDHCTLCEACVDKCPNKALLIYTHHGITALQIDVETCCSDGCGGECWDFCPTCCLSEYPCPGT